MYRKIIFTFLLIISVVSCNKEQRQFSLSKQDYSWQPYKLNDLIVFKSDKGALDSIQINSIEKRKMPTDHLDVLPVLIETLHVSVLKIDNGKLKNYPHEILKITAGGKKKPLLGYYFVFQQKWFYGSNGSNKFTVSKSDFGLKENVYVSLPTDTTYAYRKNYIDKLYWSKDKGLLGYDMRKGEKWRVVKSQSSIFNR